MPDEVAWIFEPSQDGVDEGWQPEQVEQEGTETNCGRRDIMSIEPSTDMMAEEERDSLQASFDLRWKAETGRKLTCWLLEKVEELEAKLKKRKGKNCLEGVRG